MKRKVPLFLSAVVLFGVVTTSTSCSLLNNILNVFTDTLGISLSVKKMDCVVGQVFKIKVYWSSDGSNEEYTNYSDDAWSSTNTNVATVTNDGTVTCHAVGSCSIKFKALGIEESSISCSVKVQEKRLTDLVISRLKTKYPVSDTPYDIKTKLDYSISAVYQNGYKEPIKPKKINASEVNTTVKGDYRIIFSHSLPGGTEISKEATISIVDPSEIDDRVELERDVNDYISNSVIRVTGYPHKGTIKPLVIPIKFTDSDTWITPQGYSNIREDIQKVFFSNDTTNDIGTYGWESVKTYYEKESKVDGLASEEAGLISIDGVVSNWYQDTKPSSYYLTTSTEMVGSREVELGPSSKEQMLEEAASDWYFSTTGEDRKDYDSDGDGFIDAACFVYARPDYSTLGESKNNFWYHVASNSGQTPNMASPTLGRRLWVSYSHMYPEIRGDSIYHRIVKERTGKSDYIQSNNDFAPSGTKLSARTYIHETGHMLGLDDYYSYTTSDNFASGNTMQTYNVGGHDPYSLLIYNWAKPYIPTESTTIQIGDIQSSHDVILLTPEFNEEKSPFDEYILVELFADTGLNEFDSKYSSVDGTISTQGVRIWHVDSRLIQYKSSTKIGEIVTDPLDISSTVELINDNSPNSPTWTGLEEYDKYQLLYLIRNDKDMSYTETKNKNFVESYYFTEGDVFTLEDYNKQFVENNKLNNGKTFNWTISIGSIEPTSTGYSTTITLTKTA